MSRTDLNPGPVGGPWKSRDFSERKLVCSNNWDRAPPPEHSGEQQLDGLPLALVPSSATIPSNNFTRCHVGRRMERRSVRLRYPQRYCADLGQGCFIHKTEGVLTMQ